MPDELLRRLRRFHEHSFPLYRAGPGELFMVRNVGALVPPC
ncbi:hypothetical protein [Piscinibacter terrae]|nr:hypothetical protein [Albitalea terrae]